MHLFYIPSLNEKKIRKYRIVIGFNYTVVIKAGTEAYMGGWKPFIHHHRIKSLALVGGLIAIPLCESL